MFAFASVAVLVYHTAAREVGHQVDLRLDAESDDLLGRRGEDTGRAALVARIRASEARRRSYTFGYMLLDPAGRQVAGSVSMLPPPPGFSDVDYTDRLEGLAGIDHGRALATRTPDGDMLVIVADSDPVDGSRLLLLKQLWIGFGLAALIVVIGMLSMVRAIRLRLRAVRIAAQTIADGDLTPRLPVSGRDDEFDQEAATLNHMLDRIAGLMANLKMVSDDIAHDLRTPLGRIRSQLVALSTCEDAAAIRAGLAVILGECDDMLNLFTAILRLSEIESGARRKAFSRVDPAAILDTVITTMTPAVEAGGRRLQAATMCSARIAGDKALLSQMVINAIENAMRYTPAGSSIRIAMHKAGEQLTISIADNGPGIAIEDRALALRRFGRVNAAQSIHGHGLGLPLIDAIARLHNGTVGLEDAQPGLAVVIRLPLNSEGQART